MVNLHNQEAKPCLERSSAGLHGDRFPLSPETLAHPAALYSQPLRHQSFPSSFLLKHSAMNKEKPQWFSHTHTHTLLEARRAAAGPARTCCRVA